MARLCPPDRLQTRALPDICIRPDDIFIVSYPRCGNTWLRFLVANVLAPEEEITFRNIENYVPSIYKSAALLDRKPGRRFIKSHNPCYELYPRLIYIYRDGRDALVSYYHYARGKKVFSGTFEQFVRSKFVEQFTSWKEHVASALSFSSKYPHRILLLCYEQMLENPLPALADIAAFADLKFDPQILRAAAEKSSFARLQKVEQRSGGETLGKKVVFFRSGKKQQWRDYFRGELYDWFLRENADTLLRLGYEL